MDIAPELVVPPETGGNDPYDVQRIRQDFPILKQTVHGKPLVYLDNAATTQKPWRVIDAVSRFYSRENSNIHRGVHFLSQSATAAYEDARTKIQRFINASQAREIVFVRGATEAINLVAQAYGRSRLQPGDEVVVSWMEHHSNIVPWQIVCGQTGARLRVIPVTDAGELLLDEYERLLGPRTRLVAVSHMSNVLGVINPVRTIVESARRRNVPVLVDGAQAVAHLRVDVQDLDCDFYAFSGHKLYGPSGIGVLYGKASLLESMPPYQGGGDMISSVTFQETLFNDLPHKFEAGTPNIAGALGLGVAVDYFSGIGIERAAAWEQDVLRYAMAQLSTVPGLRLVGTAPRKAGVQSFVIEGIHPHDIGTIVDESGIAIRTGHHCAQPLMDRYGLPAVARLSLALYNTREEIDALLEALAKAVKVFS
jgi:cysteine desulfurase/selenocysteine lyase